MEAAEISINDIVEKVCSWIPNGSPSDAMSRDNWMQDNSCSVCNECGSQFNLFNRRHHCRICGRIFCGNCSQNKFPTTDGCARLQEEGDQHHICRFCFNKREEDSTSFYGGQTSPSITPSSSIQSLSSITTTTTSGSSSTASSGHPQLVSSGFMHLGGDVMDTESGQKQLSKLRLGRRSNRLVSPKGGEGSPSPYDFCSDSRSGEEDDDCLREAEIYHSSCQRQYKQDEEEDGRVHIGTYGSHDTIAQNDQELAMRAAADFNIGGTDEKSEAGIQSFSKRSGLSEYYEGSEEGADDNSFYAALYKEPLSLQEGDLPLDIENNALLWVAPPPEDEEDRMGISGGDDDDDDSEGVWCLSHSLGSLSNSKYRSKEKSVTEEQRKAMRAVVDGHFRVLVSQLLNGEGIQADEGGQESWLEIVTMLSLQAASVVKPDTSIGGGMDPGGYVKVKCVATGRPSESQVVKGIVCKKNVAHRRMMTRFKAPRLLLLGGALEFQMVSNHLSSLETVLQQETDHISMAVSRIAAHHPNVLLVEKAVSRQAQERLLAKEISLVFNVKRPLLDRIARCTGATIISNLNHLTLTNSAKVGHCELFHVEKYIEEHGSAGQGGKKLTKTLMFFEDCPKPLGCSILLKGSNSDELKKVKRAVQFAVFAAYHLALETSFLADEGVDLPELRLKSPLSVALPDKKSKSDMSISTVSGFLAPTSSQAGNQAPVYAASLASTSASPLNLAVNRGDLGLRELSPGASIPMSGNSSSVSSRANSPLSSPFREREGSSDADSVKPCTSSTSSGLREAIGATLGKLSPAMTLEDFGQGVLGFTASVRRGYLEASSALKASQPSPGTKFSAYDLMGESTGLSAFKDASKSPAQVPSSSAENQAVDPPLKRMDPNCTALELHISQTRNQDDDGQDLSQEDFPPSPSNHQSILVSFSSSCLRKGTICERGHLFRIKYYGTFDKPLGRFLRETIFDTTHKCPACGELKDAHVDCYTHRQGSLTISVHKQSQALSGESEGKIWMWHRCLKCPRVDGIPPATPRLIMSDPAWGLSFGKFLELSFSNHAAASRVASCGHSLHRDCLRFYGFGNMVACLRYSPVNVYSVYLPPSKLEFHYSEHQDWLQQEIKEIAEKGDVFFKDVFNRLQQIKEKTSSTSGEILEVVNHISELEDISLKQKDSFQIALHNAASCHGTDQPHVDILQLNYIRRSLSNCSSLWENRIQSLLSSLKSPKASSGFDSVLIGDSLLSFLKDISFGSGRKWKTYVSKEASSVAVGPNLDGSKLELLQGTGTPSCRGTISLSNTENIKRTEGTMPVIDVEVAPRGWESVTANRIETFNDPESLSLDAGLEDRLYTSSSSSGSSYWPTKVESVVNAKLLEGDIGVHRSFSEDHFSAFKDVSATFDAAWTGEGKSLDALGLDSPLNEQVVTTFKANAESGAPTNEGSKRSGSETSDEGSLEHCTQKFSPRFDSQLASTLTSPVKAGEPSNIEGWVGAPYSSFSGLYSGSASSTLSGSPPRADAQLLSTSSFVVSHAEQATVHEGVKVLLTPGINETIVSVYDDEPTSIIAYAITSQEHQGHLFDKTDKQKDKEKDQERTVPDYNGGGTSHLLLPVEGNVEQGNGREIILLSSNGLSPHDPMLYSKAMHVKVNFVDDTPQGKIKYAVTCYYAKQFDGLRKRCCPRETDFIRSLCRCRKWGAQGGKSNVFFAKTADNRFVVKQVTKTELDSFITFAPAYFKYISDALITGSPTCLAKILGIYQVMVKHVKGGKELRMDLMIMENLLYGRQLSRVYDLKGSSRSRYNADASGKNSVLLDQNLLESIQTNPIFISNKAKRLLERAVWNDTAFLASVDVMDYSLLVGVDEERRDLVLGIIDFMRQYTWDKHLETWVKASGILGGPKNATPTVISPKQYKKRFRKAMSTYFLMVPDQWSPLTVVSGPPHFEFVDESSSVAVKDGPLDDSDIMKVY